MNTFIGYCIDEDLESLNAAIVLLNDFGVSGYLEAIRQKWGDTARNQAMAGITFTQQLKLSEHHLYGSSRLGVRYADTTLYSRDITINGFDAQGNFMVDEVTDSIKLHTDTVRYYNMMALKRYELTNHLGNVLATISDRATPYVSGGTINGYQADIINANYYYPFGSPMQDKSYDAMRKVVYENDFSSTEAGWVLGVTQTLDNGRQKVMPTGNFGRTRIFLINMTEAGKWYKFTVTIDKGTATKLSIYAQDNSESGATLSYKNFRESGRYTIRFKALSTTSLVKVMTEGYTTGEYFWMDDLVIEEEMSGENGYRFGFNGKENDKETGTQDYGMRIYNPALGKFLSVDPLTKDYPWYTPYQFAGNKPIWATDLDGLEEKIYQAGLKDNWGFKLMMALADNTSLGKEFNGHLKNQNKIDIYYFAMSDKMMLNAGGDITSKVVTNEDGFAYGRPGAVMAVTSPAAIYNINDFNKLSRNFSSIDPKELEGSFNKGKGVILIGITSGVINVPSSIGTEKEKLANFRTSGAEVLLHEEWAHARTILNNTSLSVTTEQEHKAYHGEETRSSPIPTELMGAKYSLTNAGKAIKEINDAAKKAYKVK